MSNVIEADFAACAREEIKQRIEALDDVTLCSALGNALALIREGTRLDRVGHVARTAYLELLVRFVPPEVLKEAVPRFIFDDEGGDDA